MADLTPAQVKAYSIALDDFGISLQKINELKGEEKRLNEMIADETLQSHIKELTVLKAHHSQIQRELEILQTKRATLEADGSGRILDVIALQWRRLATIGENSFTNLTGISGATAAGIGKVIAGFGIVIDLINRLSMGFNRNVEVQLSLASAGGAYTGSLNDVTTATTQAALRSFELFLNLDDVQKTMITASRAMVIGNAEISKLAGTTDTYSSSFTNARSSLLSDLGIVSANVLGLGPVFGKTTDQMTEMLLQMRGTFNTGLGDIEDRLVNFVEAAGRTGLNMDEFWNSTVKLGESFRFVGVGLDPLASSFLVLRQSLDTMGGSLKGVAQNSIMSSKLIMDFSNAMEAMPIQNIIGMLQMKTPSMDITTAIREAQKQTPLDRAMLATEFYTKNMAASSKEELGALLSMTDEFKGYGREALPLADLMVQLLPRSAEIAKMSQAEQTKFLGEQNRDIADKLGMLAKEERMTSEGILTGILRSLKNIENVVTVAGGTTLLGGLFKAAASVPTVSTSLTGIGTHTVTPSYSKGGR